MFTGIITNITGVKEAKKTASGLAITFVKPKQWMDLELGESISVDGVCLTVERLGSNTFSCFLIPETLRKTTFGKQIPLTVNLERALKAGERFGGHFVQGHIDCIGEVVFSKKAAAEIVVAFPARFKKYVIDKGSIAVNGVSLTIVKTDRNQLTIALIPYTLKRTNLGSLKPGDNVNLEFDMLSKYVARRST